MTKIYKNANENHIACVKLYANIDKIWYSKNNYKDQVYTSDLRDAFKNGLILYDYSGSNSLTRALKYSEENGIGKVEFLCEGKHEGKNKYKFDIDYEYDDVTQIGPNMKEKYRGHDVLGGRQMDNSGVPFGFMFERSTEVYKTLSRLGDVEKTISFRISITGGGPASGANSTTLVISAGEDSKTIQYMYSYNQRVSLTTTNNTLKILLKDTTYTSFEISQFQIEVGSTATSYEPYKLVDGWDICYGVSRPDPS